MSSSDPYPQSCPFCAIAASYPAPQSTATEPARCGSHPNRSGLSTPELLQAVPKQVDSHKIEPNCCLVLSAPHVLAFLDIMPMTRGHLLVVAREHREKIEHVRGTEASDLGFWLPILSRAVVKVTGTSDYNIVQNNGVRAAQVVPHVHFHIIPRPANVPEIKSKSWSMFGRGQRGDLDDDEGEKLAADLRAQVRKEIEQGIQERSLL